MCIKKNFYECAVGLDLQPEFPRLRMYAVPIFAADYDVEGVVTRETKRLKIYSHTCMSATRVPESNNRSISRFPMHVCRFETRFMVRVPTICL